MQGLDWEFAQLVISGLQLSESSQQSVLPQPAAPSRQHAATSQQTCLAAHRSQLRAASQQQRGQAQLAAHSRQQQSIILRLHTWAEQFGLYLSCGRKPGRLPPRAAASPEPGSVRLSTLPSQMPDGGRGKRWAWQRRRRSRGLIPRWCGPFCYVYQGHA